VDELHHVDFAEGVKAILRLDPDFLMLGEMRDKLSARAAINAALSGRALLCTIHCRDAVGAVTTLRNWDIADPEIAESLVGRRGAAPRRRLCEKCQRERGISESERKWFDAIEAQAPAKVSVPTGCKYCNQIGYFGRVGVFELWRLDEMDYRAILAHKDEHSLREALARRRERSILTDAAQKVAAGNHQPGRSRGLGGASDCMKIWRVHRTEQTLGHQPSRRLRWFGSAKSVPSSGNGGGDDVFCAERTLIRSYEDDHRSQFEREDDPFNATGMMENNWGQISDERKAVGNAAIRWRERPRGGGTERTRKEQYENEHANR
jgi:hypothetical protein